MEGLEPSLFLNYNLIDTPTRNERALERVRLWLPSIFQLLKIAWRYEKLGEGEVNFLLALLGPYRRDGEDSKIVKK